MIKGTIQEEDIIIINIYAPNIGALQYVRQIVGDFNTPLTPMDRSTKQQINKDQTQRTSIKSSKGKTTNNMQGDCHKESSSSFNRKSSGKKGMARHTESDERKNPTAQMTVPSKDLIQI